VRELGVRLRRSDRFGRAVHPLVRQPGRFGLRVMRQEAGGGEHRVRVGRDRDQFDVVAGALQPVDHPAVMNAVSAPDENRLVPARIEIVDVLREQADRRRARHETLMGRQHADVVSVRVGACGRKCLVDQLACLRDGCRIAERASVENQKRDLISAFDRAHVFELKMCAVHDVLPVSKLHRGPRFSCTD